MTIGQRIKQRRIELGLSQEQLAHKLGNKSRASVCTVENDKEDLTSDRIRKYAEALETTPAYIMGWEDKNGDLTVLGQLGDSYEKQKLLKTLSNYSSDQLAEFVKFLTLFTKATPEVQSAIETLLKSQ